MQRAILIGICLRSSQELRDVQRGNVYQTGLIFYASDCFKIQEMCIRAVKLDPWVLVNGPNNFKTQEVGDVVVCWDSYSLKYVPDWFVTQELEMSGNNLLERYNGYKQRKTQSAQIKEELMFIAWYPRRMKDWCIAEHEK